MRKKDFDLKSFHLPCENTICPKSLTCHRVATAKHHLFSDTKANRKKYGKSAIDSDKNIIFIDNGCHITRTILKFSELEFCEALGIEKAGKKIPGQS